MVAYSFHRTFADRVERRLKLSTIRGHRRRHARVDEPMQLYTAMRTKHCRKLVDPDPVCIGIDELRFDLRSLDGVETPTSNAACERAFLDVTVEINDFPVLPYQLDDFAESDGFVNRSKFKGSREPILPFFDMVFFWMAMHGPKLFEGVRLRWEHRG